MGSITAKAHEIRIRNTTDGRTLRKIAEQVLRDRRKGKLTEAEVNRLCQLAGSKCKTLFKGK